MNKYVNVGVCFLDEHFLEEAQARARRLGISFSAYVRRLVQEDIERRGDLVLRERAVAPDIPQAAARPVNYGVVPRRLKKGKP